MAYMEFKAATVEDAITNASMQLGVPSTDLDYKVVEEGTKGILGFGKKPAIIMAQVKSAEIPEKKAEEPVKAAFKEESKMEPKVEVKTEVKAQASESKIAKVDVKQEVNEEIKEAPAEKTERAERVVKNPENIDEIIEKTHKFLDDVFAAMNIETRVEIKFDKDKNDISIELFGDEMGVLI